MHGFQRWPLTLLVLAVALLPAMGGPSPFVLAVSGCGLPDPIFCETFDQPKPVVSRAGDLDPDVWGVSRARGASFYDNAWAPTQLVGCNGTTTVTPPNDVIVCNGQLREAVNDQTDVTVLAMYPKQPFDWAGRTGTVAFDVSNDTQGIHAAWPEFWITDTPVPTPFNHFDSWLSFPKNGVGLRFAVNSEVGQYGLCPNGNNLDKRRWSMDSAVAIRNYVYDDTEGFGTRTAMQVQITDCVIASPGPNGPLNHVEVRVAQNQIEVWASDAGATALRRIGIVTQANLSFTRGLIWLEDAHYNPLKGACEFVPNLPCQNQHTFTWDNVGFDGPFTYRDFSYDALDNDAVNGDGTIKLAKTSAPNQVSTWQVLNMPAQPQATAVRVLFNLASLSMPSVINVTVNGHPHAVPWPYPQDSTFGVTSWRTLPVQIPITELVPGTNVVQLGADQQLTTANVNVVLVDVPGGVPVLPGSNNAYPSGGTPPTPEPTAVPTVSAEPCYQAIVQGDGDPPLVLRGLPMACPALVAVSPTVSLPVPTIFPTPTPPPTFTPSPTSTPGVPMAITLVAHRADFSTSSNGFTSNTLDTTGADLLVVGLVQANSADGVLTDSKGNTWTQLTQQLGTSRSAELWYAKNPTVGTGHTFSVTGSSTFPALGIAAFSGTDLTAPFDVQNGNTLVFGGTIATNSVTPSVANEVLVTVLESDGTATANTIDSSFTVADDVSDTNFGHMKLTLAYQIQTTATARNPTWTRPAGNSTMAAAIASFKVAAATQGLVYGARPGGYIGQSQMQSLLAN